ncbi:hypothetical protein MMC19_007049 [Ptychographa xylographoides]|nr:hypothetical protein [Ptychographa xylographoides]
MQEAIIQWISACQCVESFTEIGYPQWTMCHAFFADMGGFILQAPDFPPFPVDGQQLIYLVKKKYIPYPDIKIQDIKDKNKADGFARAVMSIQVIWFLIQCSGRGLEHLALSTLELSTIAFIFCTINTLYFWWHKPLDVETPILLRTETRIADILIDAGDEARDLYTLTPLDFVVAPPSRWDFSAPWWAGLFIVFDGTLFKINKGARPITTFANTRTTLPRDPTPMVSFYSITILFAYFAIHFVGWNFQFPSQVEQTLWRAASLSSVVLIILYYLGYVIGTFFSRQMANFIFKKNAATLLDLAFLFPRAVQIPVLLPFFGSYTIARTYVIVEGFISLRSLPLSAYDSVDWSNYIPHI